MQVPTTPRQPNGILQREIRSFLQGLAERGIHVDASTIVEWVHRFTPFHQEAARSHRHRVGSRWSLDETYIRIAGRWRLLEETLSLRRCLIDEHGGGWLRFQPLTLVKAGSIRSQVAHPVLTMVTLKEKISPSSLPAAFPSSRRSSPSIVDDLDHVAALPG